MPLSAAADMKHFLNVFRSFASARHVMRRIGAFAFDLLRHGRSMTLFNGNALVAGLMKTAIDAGVRLETDTRCERLMVEGGRCTGFVARGPQGPVTINATRGVALACGGFPHSIEWKKKLFSHAPTGKEHWSAAPPTNTGDGLTLAVDAGGSIDDDLSNAGAWVPVSHVRRRDGSACNFPHLVDRGRPGVIAVTRAGMRFVNESLSYHDFMQGLFRATPLHTEVTAYLVCDHKALRRYGLGFAKPFPFPVRPYVASGYLIRGRSVAELAKNAEIDPDGLQATVAAFNADAEQGHDSAFDRGSTVYQRFMGDAAVRPNPCLSPLATPPYYAVQIRPGSLGTFAGIKTDERARVLGPDGRPFAGLYAVGNDMANVMKGSYPGGGVTLGPAMTFGYVAGLDLAGHHPANSKDSAKAQR
jgi:succinate dehydrogenase/fumarate reductase flavoprotein subunit